MPRKPTLPQATLAISERIIGALSTRFASPETIREKLGGNVVVSVHLRRLAQFGKITEKNGKYAKVTPVTEGSNKETPKSNAKKSVARVLAVTEASVKAELDAAIQGGNTAVIGELLIKVFDGFVHEKSQEFFQLRYMANWCRTKTLSGPFISKAYTLLVGEFMPFVLKLRRGEVDMDIEREFVVRFTDDAGANHATTVRAICPSRAIVEVRKSQRKGFHLDNVKEKE